MENDKELKTSEINKYKETLEFVVEREKRIKMLQQHCIDLKNMEEKMLVAMDNLAAENKLLHDHLNALHKEAEALKRYEDETDNNFQIPLEEDLSERLMHLRSLLNYHVTEFTKENHRAKMTLLFNNYCWVQLEMENSYELLHIEPMPANFTAIRQFLQQTQDIQGFLLILRKFFIFTTRGREENQEKSIS